MKNLAILFILLILNFSICNLGHYRKYKMNDICAKEKIKLAIETKINMLNSIKNNINLKELASFDYNSIENLNQAIDDHLNIGVKLPCLYIIQINKNLELSYVKNKKEQCTLYL